MFGPCYVMQYIVHFLVFKSSRRASESWVFVFAVFAMLCLRCLVAVINLHLFSTGVVSWSEVFDCGIYF